MSTELKDLIKKLVQNKGKQDDAIDLFAYERGLRDAIAALSDRPLTVIVPPIEWGEWREIENDFYKPSNKGYTLVRRFASDVIRVHLMGRNSIDGSEEELMAACQAHLQAQVNTALEGCNVRPWVDPQGLVEAIKTARPKIIKLLQRFGTMDAERDPLTELDAAIKAWEESK